MRYYVMTSPGGSEEVVRISEGTPMYFDAKTRRWVPDPLLALEVRMSNDWREVASHELPLGLAHAGEGVTRTRKFGTLRRGRHSRK